MEKDIVVRIEELMDLFDDDEVTTADKIERPQSTMDRDWETLLTFFNFL